MINKKQVKLNPKQSVSLVGDKIGAMGLTLANKVVIGDLIVLILASAVIFLGIYLHRQQEIAFENQKKKFQEILKIQEEFSAPDLIENDIKPKREAIDKYSYKVALYSNYLKIVLFSLLFGFIIFIFISKHFTDIVMVRPLMHMVDTSRKIAEGDLTSEVKIKSKDEIGMLGETFNYMTNSLRETIEYQKEQISKLLEVVNAAAQGNLTRQANIDSDDEFGSLSLAFNTMNKNLSSLVAQVEDAAGKINLSACNILASTEQQSAGITEQATQIAQIASSLQELTASSRQIARSAQEVDSAAQRANSTATSGGKIVLDSISAIKKIEQTVQGTAKKIKTLGESSKKIGKVITAISDIAEQTNLLALNAAIEAARAGEQGRGFAVVAEEIRKLAERSSSSAEEINNLITSIQTETNSTVMAMEDGLKSVEEGVKLINSSGESFKEIIKVVEYSTDLSREISLSTDQQTKGSEQLSYAVTNLSQVIRETEAAARSNAQASHELNGLSKKLKAAISEIIIR